MTDRLFEIHEFLLLISLAAREKSRAGGDPPTCVGDTEYVISWPRERKEWRVHRLVEQQRLDGMAFVFFFLCSKGRGVSLVEGMLMCGAGVFPPGMSAYEDSAAVGRLRDVLGY